MAVDPGEECRNIHNVALLHDEGISNLQQYQPTPNIPDLETFNMIKGEICFNSERIKKGKVFNYPPGTLDADIEKGTTEITNSYKESVGNLKSEDPLARILPTKICLQIGGKFMQFLVNHGPELPKFTSRDKFPTERIHDTSSNRARKYKRSASFNSRRVLLLFSFLFCTDDAFVRSFHWILTFINPYKEVIYLLDSLYHRIHDEDWKYVVQMVLRLFNSSKGSKGRKHTLWEVINGPRQQDTKQCGFYVMRFMREIIDEIATIDRDSLRSIFKTSEYSRELIDEVRSEWAECIQDDIIE